MGEQVGKPRKQAAASDAGPRKKARGSSSKKRDADSGPGSKTPAPKKRSRRTKEEAADVDVNLFKFQQNELADWLAMNVDWNQTFDTLKDHLKAACHKHEYFKLNIYWTRFACGVKMFYFDDDKSCSKDVAYYSFGETQEGMAMAVACAEHLATRHTNAQRHVSCVWGKTSGRPP